MCSIHYDYEAPSEMFGLNCGHRACKECLASYLETNIKDGKVLQIKCFQNDCALVFNREDVQKFGSQDIFRKYVKFKENIEVDMDPSLRWCPMPGCCGVVKGGVLATKVECNICSSLVCFKCGQQWHKGRSCKQVQDTQFQEWAQLNDDVAKCPKCRRVVQKIPGGCNHMRCT